MKKNCFLVAATMLLATVFVSCKKESPAALPEENSIAPVAALAESNANELKPSTGKPAAPFPLETFSWKIGYINIAGNDLTPSYCEYGFVFNTNNAAIATKESETVPGTWTLSNGNSFISMLFDPINKENLIDLNTNWRVVRITANSVYLKTEGQLFENEVRFDKDPNGVK